MRIKFCLVKAQWSKQTKLREVREENFKNGGREPSVQLEEACEEIMCEGDENGGGGQQEKAGSKKKGYRVKSMRKIDDQICFRTLIMCGKRCAAKICRVLG